LQYSRGRYDDAKVGRWISQDPFSFGASDSNLYRYVRNEAIQVTDPLGLWSITRRPGRTNAAAVAAKNDTIQGLAAKIGLDPSEFRNWLDLPNGFVNVTDHDWGENELRTSLRTLRHSEHELVSLKDLKVDEPISAGEIVYVPNIFLATWMGDLGDFGKHAVSWTMDKLYLVNRGFYVQMFDRGNAVASQLGSLAVYYNRL